MTLPAQRTIQQASLGLDIGTFAVKGVLLSSNGAKRAFRHTGGNPLAAAIACMDALLVAAPDQGLLSLGLTGINAHLFAKKTGCRPLFDVESIYEGIIWSGITCDAVLSLGHENMYYLELGKDRTIGFINRNGQCAAGSGAFWHQQATRMGLSDAEMSSMALSSASPVKISGRCAVFAKSDMTHAINEGATQAEVCAGLARTLAEMIVKDVTKNRILSCRKVIAVGGVAENEAVIGYVRQICQVSSVEVAVPDQHLYLPALGAAVRARPVDPAILQAVRTAGIRTYEMDGTLPRLDPRTVHYSEPLAEHAPSQALPLVYLGVDCGSVSTKCVLIDGDSRVIGGVYLPTAGRPALQVLELMKQVKHKYGGVLGDSVLVACTTGSGRFLSQKVLNAEYAVDEITCQAEAIKHLYPGAETLSVIEIGGEDSKFLKLKHGILQDYNMNPVCAAGTGTFLENLSGILGVSVKQEFSEKAFQAGYAIDLGDRCTLLSQSTLAVAASQGLPLESQVASLAYSAARNYLSKTAERRTLEGQTVFTGATAKNHALVSAFAHETGSTISVPPSPELTGALGSALMAKKLHESGATPDYTFRGLDRLNSFGGSRSKCRTRCEHGHECNLHVLRFADGSAFIYGDRCGRYSGLEKKALAQYDGLPDYGALRDRLFYEAATGPATAHGTRSATVPSAGPATGPTVGIARGGLFFDLYPFWSALFRSLGATVVLSAETSSNTLEHGKKCLDAEMCYPVEVLIGHYKELADSGLDFIFVPEVLDMWPLPWSRHDWRQSRVCPLIQTIHGTVMSSLPLDPEKVLYVQMSDWFGNHEQTADIFRGAARRVLGGAYTEAQLHRAVRDGYRALEEFSTALEQESKTAIDALSRSNVDDTIVGCFLGRSYTIYDLEVSKHSLSYARQRGIVAVPQEYFLAYAQGWYEGRLKSTIFGTRAEFDRAMTEMVRSCGNLYPTELQRIISAALIVRHLNQRRHLTGMPLIHTILQDPFRCGSNAILRHYLSMISNSLRLTMDEHTAPAGMITRLEAFKNTCRRMEKPDVPTLFSGRTLYARDLDHKRILVPQPTEHSRVFVAMFRNAGVESDLLPASTDRAFTFARRFVNGEECLPLIQNMQDILEYCDGRGAAGLDRTVFFQGWACGPCRYGMYAPTQSLLLDKAGYGERRICSVKLQHAIIKFGLGFAVGLYDGLLAVDALYKMLYFVRPHQTEPGAAEALFDRYLDELVDVLSEWRFNPVALVRGTQIEPVANVVRRAAHAFAAVPRSGEPKPRIIVAGEFYVRLDDRCNQYVIEKIERAGGQAMLSPATEFLAHAVYRELKRAREALAVNGGLGARLGVVAQAWVSGLARRDQVAIEECLHELIPDTYEPDAAEIEQLSSRYVSRHYGGEPPATIGSTCAQAGRGRADGAVFVAPFGCMPGAMVEAQVERLRRDLGIPIVSLYYDGTESPNTQDFVEGVVMQARQRMRTAERAGR
ncbi:MAG: acyl-CoA dehydratase activase [Bacillota bacterium]|nr:acyl-CoA dehydratase activase [Bacillota bacterium]